MRLHIVGAAVIGAGLLAARPAAALKLTLAPAETAVVGKPSTFRVASMTEVVGTPNLRWNFGDGTVLEPSPATMATHTYAEPGHYTVIVQGTDDADGTSVNFTLTAVNALTPVPPKNSTSILLDPERHRIWNVNQDSDTVSVIDPAKLTREREFPVGREPHSLAQAPDKSIWVTNQDSDEVVVLNRDTGAIETRIALPYASQPHAIAFGPSGMGYVSLFATGKLVELDGAARKVSRELALGPTPAGISVAGDGRIYVTRLLSPVDHGEIWAISPQSFQLANTITLPFDMGPDTQSSGRGVPNYVFSMVISPDGTQALVSATKDDVARGQQRDGLPMNADNFVRPVICKIDMKTEMEVVEKRQDIDNRSLPVTVAYSALGDYAFVLVQASNWIGIYDAYGSQQVSGIRDVGHGPDGLVLQPDGKLFVNAFLSREVIGYDVTSSIDSSDHAAPEPFARIKVTDHDKLTPQLLNGKQIFYNSADFRMGHAGYWSCASCHFGGVSDGRVWDFTDRGEGLRNTKTLLGIRGTGEGRIHWSANMDEIQDLERDIRHDFLGLGFMSDTDFDAHKGADGKYDTFGKPAAGVNPDLDALAAYITSLKDVRRSPFRNPDGSFTKDALLGRKVFEKAGCASCHLGPDFTDSSLGLTHDVGTLVKSSADRLFQPITALDTPSLKGAWQSAPYLHDGRAPTLAEVFTTYNRGDGMGKTSDLSKAEIDQLVAYVQELDDVPETAAADDTAPAADTGLFACSVGASRTRGGSFAGFVLACCALGALRRRQSREARPS